MNYDSVVISLHANQLLATIFFTDSVMLIPPSIPRAFVYTKNMGGGDSEGF